MGDTTMKFLMKILRTLIYYPAIIIVVLTMAIDHPLLVKLDQWQCGADVFGNSGGHEYTEDDHLGCLLCSKPKPVKHLED